MKKKIFFNGRFLTQSITGVQRTAHETIKALDLLIDENVIDKSRFKFVLIAPKGELMPLPLRHIRLVQKGYLKGNVWEQVELPLFTAGHLLISMGFVSSLVKTKQMVVVHDAATFSNPEYFKRMFRLWYQSAIRVLSRTARRVITVSDYSKAQLVSSAGIKESKISVIYNAADHITRFGEADEAFKRKVDALKPFMLGVSSLHPHKNFEALSKALTKAELGEYKMLIAGGAHSKSFDRVVLDKLIVVLGYVTDEQLKYLYSNASLFIFPSLFEGFGIPPLEAMTLGCPVLAARATAVPEILGDACEYFDPGNAADLVEKLEFLVRTPPRLAELREKGRMRAALYSWQKSAAAMFELIEKFA